MGLKRRKSNPVEKNCCLASEKIFYNHQQNVGTSFEVNMTKLLVERPVIASLLATSNSIQKCSTNSTTFNNNNRTTKNNSYKNLLHFNIIFQIMILLVLMAQPCFSIVNFFSKDDLKYTFGVDHLSKVPVHKQFYPRLIPPTLANNNTNQLYLLLDGKERILDLKPVTHELIADRITIVQRENPRGGGDLKIEQNIQQNSSNKQRNGWSKNDQQHLAMPVDECHFHVHSEKLYAALSNCDGTLKGTIILEDSIYVIHPIPERHMIRAKRAIRNEENNEMGLHVIYKRSNGVDPAKEDFCGIESTITSEELSEDEAGVVDDVFVVGQRLVQESDLVVELAIFVDELLWRHFSAKYGSMAWQKLQQYAVTMLNNIQIMYRQPSAVPQLTFRVVRYEVFKTQPSAMAPHLHGNGHAQRYLDRFCRYQRSLGIRDWDHALLLTGYDIHRGAGSTSISGIARLDGMCDSLNTCTLAEGLDFTSAFIGTHELGHSVGMRHDEPYCVSKYIMSASLGPGKVTWSTCSLRDYHTFLQRLDNRRKNCLRTSNLREKLPLTDSYKPGQIYDANMQCALMHGPGYTQIAPRQDHYDGICYMMWCGQGQFGRIITSHPALEGTFCGQNKWCQLGRCVPWTGGGAPLPSRSALPLPTPAPPQIAGPSPINGQWTVWSPFHCDRECHCPAIVGAVGVTLSRRTCTNPTPSNGGEECQGSALRAAVCQPKCQESQSINQYISAKCAEHKRIKNDEELTGSGSQLTRYPQRACKVFCDVKGATPRNYRFYGDSLPDGTPCGFDRYCLDGECLTTLIWHQCNNLPDYDSTTSTDIPLPQITTIKSSPENGFKIIQNNAKNQKIDKKQKKYSKKTTTFPTEKLKTTTTAQSPKPESIKTTTKSKFNYTKTTPKMPHFKKYTKSEKFNKKKYKTTKLQKATSKMPVLKKINSPTPTKFEHRFKTFPISTTTIITTNSTPATSRAFMIEEAQDEIPKLLANENLEWKQKILKLWKKWKLKKSLEKNRDLTCGHTALFPRDLATSCPNPQDRCPLNNNLVTQAPNGQWNSWSLWSSCSASCGGGFQLRTRVCSITNHCLGEPTERIACNTNACLPNGQPPPTAQSNEPSWSDWTTWNQCSVSCGRGSQARYRRCQTPQQTIAFSCQGNFFLWDKISGKTMDIRNCEELPCSQVQSTQSIAGQWANWGTWAACSSSCGPGTQIRYRTCAKEPCDGAGQQRLACNLRECAEWNQWGLWGECSKLCGKGLRSRSRTCQINNACTGSSIEQDFCNEHACAPGFTSGAQQWSTWSSWSTCSVSCGAGVKRRTRECQNGGNCAGEFRESSICNEGACSKTDASWGGWGYWSTCGNGIRRRVRKCYGSGNCYGNEYERENC